ncbi:MAG: hypothetical protein WAU47_02500 [Desulfobaccales bacterium]
MGRRTTRMTMAGLTLGGLLLLGVPAFAQIDYNPYIDHRQDYQENRIQQGIDSGALTPGEARYLNQEQARIQAAQERMAANGRLSPWERQRLDQMQDRARWDIHRLKHNGRTTPDWNGPQYPGWGRPPHPGWQGRHYGWQNPHQRGYGHPGWYGRHRGWGGQAHYPGYDHREHRQTNRIQQGIQSGSLTPGEARYLGREQVRIHGAEKRLEANGFVSPWERQRLNHMQNHASRDIYRLNHNSRTAPVFAGSQAQGPPRFHQARPQMAPAMMRPHAPMTARHPGSFNGPVNRANFTPSRSAHRRR